MEHNPKDPNQKELRARKPRVGITMGDFNGVGPEIIIKVLGDSRIANICTPIVYGSGKILTRYKRMLEMEDFNYHQFSPTSYLNEKKINVVNCWNDNHEVQPGKVTDIAGECAYLSLAKAVEDLKADIIDAVVTCPINKANIQRDEFRYAGHTEYFTKEFGASDSLMLLCSGELRVAVATGHIPVSQISAKLTKELISTKLDILHDSLRDDFGIAKPKIAVLGLNPHAGEEGLIGKEEIDVIAPVIKDKHRRGRLIYGPFPADGFFGALTYRKYDGVLAMYHDQGLIPFKTLAFETGVNYTAGLSIVRTSPDHGTAYSLAGKGTANEDSLREAIYQAVDISRNRAGKITRQLRVTVEHKTEH